MLKNYFKSIFRSLLREKGNTFINIAGLTLGITGSLVLFLIIKESNSFDKYHTKKDRIYRVISQAKGNNGIGYFQAVPTVLPDAIKNDFEEVEEVVFTSYRRGSLITIHHDDGTIKKYEEPKGTVFTEPAFFKIFDRKIIAGANQLQQPNTAIISSSSALKYFQTEDVIGKIILHDKIEYTVSAVMEDYPSNTDLPFDLMLSYITIKQSEEARGWHDLADYNNCYLLLKDKATISALESKIPAFAQKYFGTGENNLADKTFVLQPLSAIHSDMRAGNYNTRMPEQANYVLGLIAVFLIITSCINFINLTTAAAIKRTKEVGIRKVLGSTRIQLMTQFIGEAFLATSFAALISLGMAQLFLVVINSLLQSKITLNLDSDILVWAFVFALIVVVTLLSGVYPAFVLSSFKPALALKTQPGNARTSGYVFRRSLVVLQFFISQFFIIGTIVLTKQLNFFQQQDMGFNKEAILVVPIPVDDDAEKQGSKMRALKTEILRIPNVEMASLAYSPPSSRGVKSSNFQVHGDQMDTQVKEVDGHYLDLFSIEVLRGEPLADSDTISFVVVNEKFVQQAGYSSNEEIIGSEIEFWGKKRPVKGVVKNFNTTSLEREIEPVVLLNNSRAYESISIKLNTTEMPRTIEQIQKQWEATYPEYIFSYEFLDEQIRALYTGERRISTLLTIFSTIAIFIGCLGLFGLVTFMANQKIKEIGVRKVLGASVESIIFLFSKEFIKLILIGFALAGPAAGFIMHQVLQEFAYKITIGPSIFITGLGVTFFIAFITVGYRSIQAAHSNPADSLRSE